jgi:hypothetical protein
MELTHPLALAAYVLAGLLALRGALALFRLRRSNVGRELALRGRRGEDEAEAELRRRFLRVVRHPRREQRLWIDGRAQSYELCPDFVVGTKRRPLVIEVKSGKARDPRDPATRRQLLEYALAFGARRVGLYDARERALQWIEFEVLPRRSRTRALALFAAGLLVGAAVARTWGC